MKEKLKTEIEVEIDFNDSDKTRMGIENIKDFFDKYHGLKSKKITG